jgi:hypothetical protein
MSIALMAAAWELEIASTDKLVLLALADNANDAGCCWPSMATIARKCGLKERATRIAMRRLESAGYVTSVDRTGTSRLYTVNPGIKCPPASNAPRHEVPVTPALDAPKPSRTTISSTKTSSSPKKRTRTAVEIVVPDWVPADAWNGWLEMRRTKGTKTTARALQLAIEELKKLADDGHPPGEVLDQSTLKGWTGLFPIKDHRNGLSPRDHHTSAGRQPRADRMARPRRGYAADMLAAAHARPEDGSEGDPRDCGGAEGPLPAYLR